MNNLRALWASGGTAVGAWLVLREPLIAEAASRAGYDYVCVDLQHGVLGFEHLNEMVAAIALGTATPIVRVPFNEPWMIGRALDAGALGVIVPQVESGDAAMRAVSACRYAPAGSRSIGPTGAIAHFGVGYFGTANVDVLCIVMVESALAVERVDEIVATAGVDAVYVGPADLSLTLDLPPGVDQTDDRFSSALARVIEACERHDVIPGIHAIPRLVAARQDAGFRLITAGFDHAPVVAALTADLRTARQSTGSSS